MGSTQATKDRRRMKRWLAKAATRVSCRQDADGFGPNIAVRVLDISIDGVRIVATVALREGEAIQVTLTPPVISRPFVRSAAVAWCRPLEGSMYQIGVKFQKPLTYNDVFYMT